MPVVRRIARTTAVRPRTATPAKPESTFEKGIATQQAKNAFWNRVRERRMSRPLPFFLIKGKSAPVILLDKEPHLFHEHHWKGPSGRWDQSEVCLKDSGEICPGCTKFGVEGTWIMGFTIIDLTPYTFKSGPKNGQTTRYTRKFLAVKSGMIEKYNRLYQSHDKNFRGLILTVFRGTGEKSARTGDDFEVGITKDGRRIERLTDAQLAQYKDAATICDYAKAYSPLPASELAMILNTKVTEAVGREEFEPDDTEIPF